MQYRLRIYGPGGVQDFVLPLGEFIIGRNPVGSNKLTVPVDYMLDTHLVFRSDGSQCAVILGAGQQPAHETRLNGRELRVNITTPVNDGDQLTIRNPSAPDRLITFFFEIFGDPLRFPVMSPSVPSASSSPYKVPPGLSCQSTRLLPFLPAIYQPERPIIYCEVCDHDTPPDTSSETFLSRYLALFESILLPIEGSMASFDFFLNPRTAPKEFLPWLENWFGLEENWTEMQRRALIAGFAWRGTRLGLHQLLETYIGKQPAIIDEDDALPPHTFRVIIPMGLQELAQRQISETSIRMLIDVCKPAHTAYLLEFKPTATAGVTV